MEKNISFHVCFLVKCVSREMTPKAKKQHFELYSLALFSWFIHQFLQKLLSVLLSCNCSSYCESLTHLRVVDIEFNPKQTLVCNYLPLNRWSEYMMTYQRSILKEKETGRVIPKTQKMVLDPSLLYTQHYKVRIKAKWSNQGKGVTLSPTPWCSSYRKGSLQVTLDIGRQLYLLLLTNISFLNNQLKSFMTHARSATVIGSGFGYLTTKPERGCSHFT